MKKQRLPEPGLKVEFICPKCNTHLAWASPTVQMSCPKCGKWVTDKNRKRSIPELLLKDGDDQLCLF